MDLKTLDRFRGLGASCSGCGLCCRSTCSSEASWTWKNRVTCQSLRHQYTVPDRHGDLLQCSWPHDNALATDLRG